MKVSRVTCENSAPLRTVQLSGFDVCGVLKEEEVEILRTTEKEIPLGKRSHIYWHNIWQRASGKEIPDNELSRLVKKLVDLHYDEGSVIDGFGFIVNPLGSGSQRWHLDYDVDYSTIFIPMRKLGTHNATQYISFITEKISDEVFEEALKDLDCVDLDVFDHNDVIYTVSQCIAPKYSLLKMRHGTIHRGIMNTGTEDRVNFFVSTTRNPNLLIKEELEVSFEVNETSVL